MTDTFAMIATQRRAVADVLESLSAEEWRTPSLCDQWRVQELAAHLTMPFRVSNAKFFLGALAAGGSIAKVMDKYAKAHSGEAPERLIAFLRDGAESRFVPPTFPVAASLNEIVVHGFDVALPTGRHVEVPDDVARRVLEYLVSTRAGTVHTKRRLAHGVHLVSTDSDWTWGAGPEVRGTNFGLIMTLARRPLGFDHVSGEGVEVIRRRLTQG
ncbi:MAG: maleylpyruvate isomerase family mycothiol-dependent enzyme [Actinomycetota bacterium]|nr:maleylpyruvate isomerase family mycothiol-dependent enzyme [Actinomycetota bacterium]